MPVTGYHALHSQLLGERGPDRDGEGAMSVASSGCLPHADQVAISLVSTVAGGLPDEATELDDRLCVVDGLIGHLAELSLPTAGMLDRVLAVSRRIVA